MNLKKLFLVIITFAGLILQGFAQEQAFPVPTGNSKQLFYLQRTHNTNTIVYELNYKDGIIDAEVFEQLHHVLSQRVALHQIRGH